MASERSPAHLVTIAAVVAGYVGLLAVGDFQARPVPFLLIVVALFAALWRLTRRVRDLSLPVLLGVAALARVLLVPVPPTLSDEVFRDLWDGRVLVAGFDPYRLPPDDPELAPLRDELWERIERRDVETARPPLALALSAAAASLPSPVLGWKAMLALLDLGSCWLLWRIARRTSLPTSRVAWYAWNPLVVVEGAGMGHLEVAGVLALVAGVHLVAARSARDGDGLFASERARPRPGLAGALVGLAGLVALVPLLTVPLLARHARSWLLAVVALVVAAVGLAPMLVPSAGLPPGLKRTALSWDHDRALPEPLWRALDATGTPAELGSGLDAVRARLPDADALAWADRDPAPRLLAQAILVVGLGWVVVVGIGARPVAAAVQWTLGGAVLLGTVFDPWSVLWVLPFAALRASPAWLALTLTAQASHLPLWFGWSAWPIAWTAVWAPFAAVALWCWWRRRADAVGAPR